jgi:glycosyltransferase involved in cell wall biosynthesis
MKLIIQIPCFNEAETLGVTLAALPRQVAGFDEVEWLVIDDGSTDGTADVARRMGVDHVVRHICNRGLAHAFMSGVDSCLVLGADVIVNTDADNQYNADDIPALTAPILEQRADLVIGARPIPSMDNFSRVKKLWQRLGSWVVRVVSGTDVKDAPSGFRAISRHAAQHMMVFDSYTYTLETIIQAGQKNLQIVNVPVRVNPELRPSRLVKNIAAYIKRSILTMVRVFVIYRPTRVFGTLAIIMLGAGLLLGLRFLYFWLAGEGEGMVQSLILAAILIVLGFQSLITAFLADTISANRRLLEEIRFTQRAALPRRASGEAMVRPASPVAHPRPEPAGDEATP